LQQSSAKEPSLRPISAKHAMYLLQLP
jgi:hypothetical protein